MFLSPSEAKKIINALLNNGSSVFEKTQALKNWLLWNMEEMWKHFILGEVQK